MSTQFETCVSSFCRNLGTSTNFLHVPFYLAALFWFNRIFIPSLFSEWQRPSCSRIPSHALPRLSFRGCGSPPMANGTTRKNPPSVLTAFPKARAVQNLGPGTSRDPVISEGDFFFKGGFSYIHLTKKRCETVPTVGSLGAVFGRSSGMH